MKLYELVDGRGEPYENTVLERFVHKARAERALTEARQVHGNPLFLDGRSVLYLNEIDVNDEER